MSAQLPTPNHCTMIAFIQTQTVDGVPYGYALVERKDGAYITVAYKWGGNEWAHGNYFEKGYGVEASEEESRKRKTKAMQDLMERAADYYQGLKPFPKRKTPADLGLTRSSLRNIYDALSENRPERDQVILETMARLEHLDTLDHLEDGDKARHMLKGAGYDDAEIGNIAEAAMRDWNNEDEKYPALASSLELVKACGVF